MERTNMTEFIKKFRRIICSFLTFVMLSSTVPVNLLAQDYLSTDERQSYVSEVTSRAALYEDLENRKKQAEFRRQTIEKSISNLQSQSAPADTNASAWNKQRTERVSWLNDYLNKNERNLEKYESNINTVKTNLAKDRKYIMSSDDPELKQSLGVLIGVAGIAGIPIASRPTMGSLKASVGRSMMGSKLSSTNKSITKLTAKNTALQTKASMMKPPSKGSWSTHVTPKGDLVLKNGSQIKKLGVKAQVKSADGTMIKNKSGYAKAQHYKEIYTTKSSISHRIDTLKYERGVTKNTKAQKAIDTKIKQLEGKRTQIKDDIAKAKSEKSLKKGESEKNPKKGTGSSLAASAAKWAAFSVAMTLSTRAFEQLKANDWNFKAIDWNYVSQPLKTADFWGGTAGSFAGSMLLTAMIPGGAFIKTLAGISGAAIGWQLGTGNLMETDWTELGATSIGATIGATLGLALGPIGSFIGGMLGHYAASWLLKWVRKKLHPGYTAYDHSSREAYTVDPQKAYADGINLYREPDFGNEGEDDYGSYSSGDLSALHARMLQLQTEMQNVMNQRQDGQTEATLAGLRQEFAQIQEQIYAAREQNAGNF